MFRPAIALMQLIWEAFIRSQRALISNKVSFILLLENEFLHVGQYDF